MEMQCQSCHGNMSAVGSASRVGWIMEPNCQGCHTGTATSNSGQIRYTSVFDTNGAMRVPTNQTFATTPNTPPTSAPALNLSLYRFSVGHGGLQCSACHGSTHAEFPSSHPNDNLRNIGLAGPCGRDVRMHRLPYQFAEHHHRRAARHAPGGPDLGERSPGALRTATGPNASLATAPITAARSCRGCWPPARSTVRPSSRAPS